MRLIHFGSIRAAAFLSSFLCAGSLAAPLPAQNPLCDPQLKQTSEDPNGYRSRGDRCEGVYFGKVGSTTLLVASLTESVENFDVAAGKPLLIEWTAPEGAEVHVRARALRHRLWYQMDTVRPPGSGSYNWSTALLAKFNLRRNELGWMAWTAVPVGKATKDVYVPLRVRQGEAPRSPSYQVTLLPGVELSEVFVSLAPVDRDGRVGTYIKKDEPLKYSYYPADRPITIPLPPLGEPGIYNLEIKATRRAGGGASAPPLWFSHSR
jgi:hypothetical protein